ncbi:hypothetical protein PAEPH01_1907 [Pancytospora epiphaga]|nr:hypothetical protein PAEPH01_1907 [Pancytospora epiphaga]
MKPKYPREQKGIFHNQLKKIKQENYVRIAEYEKAIQEMVGVVSIACDWGKGEMERRIKEQFFSGMGKTTSREMDILGLNTVSQILDRFFKMEEKLVEQTREKRDEKSSRPEKTFQASQSAGKNGVLTIKAQLTIIPSGLSENIEMHIKLPEGLNQPK